MSCNIIHCDVSFQVPYSPYTLGPTPADPTQYLWPLTIGTFGENKSVTRATPLPWTPTINKLIKTGFIPQEVVRNGRIFGTADQVQKVISSTYNKTHILGHKLKILLSSLNLNADAPYFVGSKYVSCRTAAELINKVRFNNPAETTDIGAQRFSQQTHYSVMEAFCELHESIVTKVLCARVPPLFAFFLLDVEPAELDTHPTPVPHRRHTGDDQTAAVPRLTHIQVLVVDLRRWFSSDRGPFQVWMVEPARKRIESLPWEAMAFADLFGVGEVTVTYGRQEVGSPGNDLFCDSHALSIICHLIGGKGMQGIGARHTFHRTKEARVLSPLQMYRELKATIDNKKRCNVLFKTGHYPLRGHLPWVDCRGSDALRRLYTGATTEVANRDAKWYQGFNQFIACLRGYHLPGGPQS